jgi:hypothetical protein
VKNPAVTRTAGVLCGWIANLRLVDLQVVVIWSALLCEVHDSTKWINSRKNDRGSPRLATGEGTMRSAEAAIILPARLSGNTKNELGSRFLSTGEG